jgi:V8-like Glu-specific endopeptidase
LEICHEHQEALVRILRDHAITETNGSDPKSFFIDLINKSILPKEWKAGRFGRLRGVPESDARNLILWAINQGTNRSDSRFTTLGSLLKPLLPQLGVEDSNFVVALITKYELYQGKSARQELEMAYQIPKYTSDIGEETVEFGPDIKWLGPSDDEIELQGFFGKPPDMLDVGFVEIAIQQSRCVCRIENNNGDILGTGFLIGQLDLLLTNYHVLKKDEADDLDSNIRNAVLRFGCFTEASGDVSKGQTFKLAKDKALIAQSPVNELDYLLLRVDDAIFGENRIKSPASWDLDPPAKKSGLHILQHPEGEAMKIAITGDAVTGVYQDKGLIQYATRARSGSSGSPCFNDDWKVVALHHAQRSKAFGSVREGILFQAIYEQIKNYL